MRRTLAILLLLTGLSAVWAQGRAVTLHVSGADLVTVLKKQIGPALGRNLYVAPEVKGTVTTDLVKVPAERALDLILRMQDPPLAYKVFGNTVVVASPERLSRMRSLDDAGWGK